MHQIRVHLQWLGHPIVDDPVYNHKAWGPDRGRGGVDDKKAWKVISISIHCLSFQLRVFHFNCFNTFFYQHVREQVTNQNVHHYVRVTATACDVLPALKLNSNILREKWIFNSGDEVRSPVYIKQLSLSSSVIISTCFEDSHILYKTRFEISAGHRSLTGETILFDRQISSFAGYP